MLKPLEGNFSIPMKPYQVLGDVYAGAGQAGEAYVVLPLNYGLTIFLTAIPEATKEEASVGFSLMVFNNKT